MRPNQQRKSLTVLCPDTIMYHQIYHRCHCKAQLLGKLRYYLCKIVTLSAAVNALHVSLLTITPSVNTPISWSQIDLMHACLWPLDLLIWEDDSGMVIVDCGWFKSLAWEEFCVEKPLFSAMIVHGSSHKYQFSSKRPKISIILGQH